MQTLIGQVSMSMMIQGLQPFTVEHLQFMEDFKLIGNENFHSWKKTTCFDLDL